MTKTVADLIAYLQTLPQDAEASIMAEESRHVEMGNLNGLNDMVKWPCSKCRKVFRAQCD